LKRTPDTEPHAMVRLRGTHGHLGFF
jgi:hypothetical protein